MVVGCRATVALGGCFKCYYLHHKLLFYNSICIIMLHVNSKQGNTSVVMAKHSNQSKEKS